MFLATQPQTEAPTSPPTDAPTENPLNAQCKAVGADFGTGINDK